MNGPRIVMVVLGVIVAVSIGAVLIVHASSGGNAAQVTYMKATLDKLPLPTGAVLIYESYTEAHGDVAAYAQRDYRLSTDHATAALRTCLDRAGYRALGVEPGHDGALAWQTETTPTAGDLNVLAPGMSGGGIELRWHGDELSISLQGGDLG